MFSFCLVVIFCPFAIKALFLQSIYLNRHFVDDLSRQLNCLENILELSGDKSHFRLSFYLLYAYSGPVEL